MTLDLRNKTPERAARKLYEYLCEVSTDIGQDPSIEVFLWTPEEAAKRGRGAFWCVSWESGPYEWAHSLSGGESLYSGEGMGGAPEVLLDGPKWYVEPHYSFDLVFVPDDPST